MKIYQITNFKIIIDYADLIIIIVIIFFLWIVYDEPFENRIFNYRKLLNMICEFGILIFYIIRYSEFAKFKNFLFAKDDIYKDKGSFDIEENYYFPNKVFNLDSFPVEMSLNMLLTRLIYIIIPQNWYCYYIYKVDFISKKEYIKYFLGIHLFINLFSLLFLSIFEFLPYGYYENLIYNWNNNPIKSIELSSTKDYEFARIKTKKKQYKFYK